MKLKTAWRPCVRQKSPGKLFLSTHLQERVEKIDGIIAKLIDESAKGTPIVVEGAKDAQSLRELGVNGRILTVKTGGKSFLVAAQEIEALGVREVILLLDFDRRGREGIRRLCRYLEPAKIKVNLAFWLALNALVGGELQYVEGLFSYLATMHNKS